MKEFVHEILSFQNLKWQHWLLIFSIFLLVHTPVIQTNEYNSNLAVFQAKAFLQGNLHVEHYAWDASIFEGKYYMCFPPFSSVLLTPLVAVFGTNVNTIFISLLLTCLSMYLLYQLLQKSMGDSAGKLWVFLAFFFGSGYWWVVLTSDYINGFNHVVCFVKNSVDKSTRRIPAKVRKRAEASNVIKLNMNFGQVRKLFQRFEKIV